MFWRFLILIIGGSLLVIFQKGFLPFLPFPLSTLDLLLFTLLFIFFLSGNLKTIFFLTLWSGFLIELFNQSAFGIYTFSLLISLVLAQWFFKNFFTNRTLPSLLFLNLFFITTFHFLFLFLNILVRIKFNYIVDFSLRDFFIYFLWELLGDSIFLSILFVITNHFTKNLKSFFLFNSTRT